MLLGVVALTSAQPAHLLQDPDSPYLTHSSRMEEEPQTGTFVALQPLALVDHVCTVSGALLGSLLANGGGTCARGTDAAELGGSKRVSLEEIQRLLGRPGARPHVCGQAACARLMPAAGGSSTANHHHEARLCQIMELGLKLQRLVPFERTQP